MIKLLLTAALALAPAAAPAQTMPAAPMPSPARVASASAEPVMTPELMSRLIARTMASPRPAVLDKRISGIFGLNDGRAHMPARQVGRPVPEGMHVFIIPVTGSIRDIVIGFRYGDVYDIYLTSPSGVLRAAALLDRTGARLITNEQAAPRYNAELALFAREAATLPPAAAVVSN